MKTPRDLILSQHRNAETKLAHIRAKDLAAAVRNTPDVSETNARPFLPWSLARNFWEESILPWRRAWAGLAGVWLAILALSMAAHYPAPNSSAQAQSADSQSVLAAWRERRQMLAQLLGPTGQPSAGSARKIPGPRSWLRGEAFVI